jgi:hypothetical protein
MNIDIIGRPKIGKEKKLTKKQKAIYNHKKKEIKIKMFPKHKQN